MVSQFKDQGIQITGFVPWKLGENNSDEKPEAAPPLSLYRAPELQKRVSYRNGDHDEAHSSLPGYTRLFRARLISPKSLQLVTARRWEGHTPIISLSNRRSLGLRGMNTYCC